MRKSDIGIYGLGVMGKNLALNLEEKGFRLSIFNRMAPGEETIIPNFMENDGAGKMFVAPNSIKDFVHSLEKPRKILLMVKAGKPVDMVTAELLPFLDKEDILLDGGNSNFSDTESRVTSLAKKGIRFVGMGVSGGEEGARFGPSLMPGGNPEAREDILPLFQKIAAASFDGKPCCKWIGNGGAGHFVKMVHNGIEYADMQLIAEMYHLLRSAAGHSPDEISGIFADWNQTELNSYLLDISAKILLKKDTDGAPLVDKILDSAGQKGTGKWTAITALNIGTPLPAITQAVFARFVSSFKNLRTDLNNQLSLHRNSNKFESSIDSSFLSNTENKEKLRKSLLAARMSVYAEGFHMIQQASDHYNWNIDMQSLAEIWQGGCIIQSKLLVDIAEAFGRNPGLAHLFTDPSFAGKIQTLEEAWRTTSAQFIQARIPAPCLLSSIAQFDGITSDVVPATIIQAQRDFFGAHTYERIDKPRGHFFHTDWS